MPTCKRGPRQGTFSDLLLLPNRWRALQGSRGRGRRAGCLEALLSVLLRGWGSLPPSAGPEGVQTPGHPASQSYQLPLRAAFDCVSFKNKAPRLGSGKSTARVWEKTRTATPEKEKGNTRLLAALDFFFFFFSDFSFKKKKSFSSRRFQEQAGGGRGGGFCSRRWSVMSHERVIKGSPVRGAGFLCAAAAGAWGHGARAAEARGRGAAGTRAEDAGCWCGCGCGRGSRRRRRTWPGTWAVRVGVARWGEGILIEEGLCGALRGQRRHL